jgi:hypothetical protein
MIQSSFSTSSSHRITPNDEHQPHFNSSWESAVLEPLGVDFRINSGQWSIQESPNRVLARFDWLVESPNRVLARFEWLVESPNQVLARFNRLVGVENGNESVHSIEFNTTNVS